MATEEEALPAKKKSPGFFGGKVGRFISAPFRGLKWVVTHPVKSLKGLIYFPLKAAAMIVSLPFRGVRWAISQSPIVSGVLKFAFTPVGALTSRIPYLSTVFQKVGEFFGFEGNTANGFGAAALGGAAYGGFVFATTGAAATTGSFIATSSVVGANALVASSVGTSAVAAGASAATLGTGAFTVGSAMVGSAVTAVMGVAAMLGPFGLGVLAAAGVCLLAYAAYKGLKAFFGSKESTTPAPNKPQSESEKSLDKSGVVNDREKSNTKDASASLDKQGLLTAAWSLPGPIGVIAAAVLAVPYLLYQAGKALLGLFSSSKENTTPVKPQTEAEQSVGKPLSEDQKACLEVIQKPLKSQVDNLKTQINNEPDPKKREALERDLVAQQVLFEKIDNSLKSGKNEGIPNISAVVSSEGNNHRTGESVAVFMTDPAKQSGVVERISLDLTTKDAEAANSQRERNAPTKGHVATPAPSSGNRNNEDDEEQEQQRARSGRAMTR